MTDMQRRENAIKIPYFTSGSYLSVMYADQWAQKGVNKFVGICIAKRQKGIGSNFILRNVINGVGVERMFETYSPKLREIKV